MDQIHEQCNTVVNTPDEGHSETVVLYSEVKYMTTHGAGSTSIGVSIMRSHCSGWMQNRTTQNVKLSLRISNLAIA